MEASVAIKVCLPEPIEGLLEQWSRAAKAPRRLIERAAVVLACARYPAEKNGEIGARLGMSRNTVAKWRRRAVEALERWGPEVLAEKRHVLAKRVAEMLADAPRSGRPADFTAEQIVQVIAIACEVRPEEAGRPISHWSGREVADEAKRRGVVPHLSDRHARRLLKKTTCVRTE